MIGQTLQEGFVLANRRFGLIFLDMLWKGVWLVITLGMVFAAFTWFGEQLRSLGWESTGVRAVDALIASALLRQFWNAHAWDLVRILAVVGAASILMWLVLEAYFRSRFLAPGTTETFRVFFASSLLKWFVLSAATTLIGLIVVGQYLTTPVGEWLQLWPETRGGVLIAAIVLVFLSFILVMIDTLVRSDAVELLGTDLFGVSGIIGTLLGFEVFIGAAASVAILVGLLNVSRMAEFITVLMFAIIAIIILNFLHSYLLLVRFSAVGIMRRNDLDI